MSAALKILIIGPSKSRKSQLANYLANVVDSVSHPSPGPTVSCRILETERNGVALELWDVSGDQSTEAGWPAIQKSADAVLMVYDPTIPGASKEVELWAQWFPQAIAMPGERCLCYKLAGAAGAGGSAPSLGPVVVESHSVDKEEAIKKSFDKWTTKLIGMGKMKEGGGGSTGRRR